MGIDNNNHSMNRLPNLGEVIDGRYRLTETFASGGMGVIMKAEQIRTGRDVAVKLLHPHIAARQDFAARFMREVKVATLFDHPHIVRVYDVGETENGSLYLVMELLKGDELKEIIAREAPFSTKRLFDLGLQMADGLAEAHSVDVVHRDFKPSNVFICKTRRGREVVKLLDFGIAKLVNSGQTQVTATGSFTGTPSYMAPEVMVDAGETNQKAADVYAAGLVFLEMLTGQRVFDGSGIAQTLLKHLKKPISIPAPLIRTPLGDVLRRATAKHPDDRYEDADALFTALEQAREGTPQDLVLRPDQVPNPATETSPSLLKKMANQGQTTNLDMLRDMPQHAAYSNDETPSSLPELPLGTGFEAEPTESLGADSTDVDDADTDRVSAEPEPELDAEFKGDPTEIYDTAGEASTDFEAEPTRAEIPSRFSDGPQGESSTSGDTSDIDNDFGYEPTRAEIPSNLPKQTDSKPPSDPSDSPGPRFDIPDSDKPASPSTPEDDSDPDADLAVTEDLQALRSSRKEEATPTPTETPTASPTPANRPDDSSLHPHLQAIVDDPKKLVVAGASVVALLFILVATPLVLLDGRNGDESDDPQAIAAEADPVDTQASAPDPAGQADEVVAVDNERPSEEEALDEALPEPPPRASLEIDSDPSGASLWVGDEELGTTRYSAELTEEEWPGELIVKKEGYQDAVLELGDYDDTETSIALEEIPEPEPEPEPRPTRPSPSPSTPPSTEVEESEDDDDDDQGSSLDHLLDQHL